MSTPNEPTVAPTPTPDEGLKVTLPGEAVPAERWLWRGLLLVLCLLAYANGMTSDKFIWDDERHAGAYAQHKDVDGLTAIWTKLGIENGGTPQYYPLTHTTFWLEYQVFKEHPVGYRIDNVLVHAGCAILLWELLRRLRVPGAFLAAVIFAVHPLMVESVAWVSERKNTLSLLLSLASLLAYAKFAGVGEYEEEAKARTEPDWNTYVLALLAFAGAMLSKSTAGYVPVVLLLGLWWKGKLTRRDVGLVAPWLLIALVLGLLTAFVEYRHVIRPGLDLRQDTFMGWLGAKATGQLHTSAEFNTPWSQRLLMSGVVPVFYLWKFFVPAELTFFYPRWDLANAPVYWWGCHVLVLGAIAWAVMAAKGGKRWPLVLVAGYLIALFPAMGFFDVYPFRYSYVADHFAYPAMWMVAVAVAAGIAIVAEKQGVARKPGVALGAGAALAVLLVARTYVHAGNFVDKTALFEQVLKHNPNSWAAMTNLASEDIQFSQLAGIAAREAAAQQEAAAQEKALTEQKDFQVKAEALLHRALELKPDHERAMFQLGMLYQLQGRDEESLAEFRRSAKTAEENPDTRDGVNPTTYQQIGMLLKKKHDPEGAKEAFRKAISLEHEPIYPKSGRTRLELLKLLLVDLRDRQAAATRPATGGATTTRVSMTFADAKEITDLAADVTELQPKNPEGWILAGDLMMNLGRVDVAVASYRSAMQLAPNSTDAMMGMGQALMMRGDPIGAEVAFEGVTKIDPSRADARRALAITRAEVEKLRATTRAAAATRAAQGKP